jgi:opacity protein-like surface antigen
MNRLITIIVIILIAASSANAQFYKGFGFKAGTSIAKQIVSNPTAYISVNETHDINNDIQYKFGLTFGIFKEFEIAHNFNSHIAVNYVRKGAITKDEFNNTVSYLHDNIDFLSAELTGKYRILDSKFSPYTLLGLRVDFFLSQDVFSKEANGNEIDFGSSSNTKKTVFGATVGAGVEYKASKQYSIFLETTFNPDLTDIYNDYQQVHGQSFDIRTGIIF